MGKLIDVDEVKKRYPIMENDFGMVVNDRLHKELDKISPAEAIPKADMVTILDDIRSEINELPSYVAKFAGGSYAIHIDKEKVLQIIDKYRGEQCQR